MLLCEQEAPNRIAYDRPSFKLINFLKKNFGLINFQQQNNNFVIFEDYFNVYYS